MRAHLARWLFGFLAGWILLAHGDPLGATLVATPAADPHAASLGRALVLLLAGALASIVLVEAPVLVLSGVFAGFAASHVLLGIPGSGSWWTILWTALPILALAHFLRRGAPHDSARAPGPAPSEKPGPAPSEKPGPAPSEKPGPAPSEKPGPAPSDTSGSEPGSAGRVNLGELAGLCCAAAGAVLALEGLARHLRRLSAGVAADESVFDTAFLACLLCGAACFGWITRNPRSRGILLPVGLCAAASAALVGLKRLADIADTRGLDRFVRAFGFDTSWHGTLGFDALVGAAVYVIPGFALGAALCAARERRSLVAATLGAAVGLALVPRLLEHDLSSADGDASFCSARLVPLGMLVAAAGGAIALVFALRRTGRFGWSGLAGMALLALPVFVVDVKPILVLSPWQQRPILPDLAFETPAGLVTVERGAHGQKLATLDRRALGPRREDLAADALLIHVSIDLLPPRVRAQGRFRVLLIGQLTPERQHALAEGGAGPVDRSATWSEAFPRLEAQLFEPLAPPPGERLAPADARERIARGVYDLVLVPPVAGDIPRLARLDVPETTVVVRWFRLDEPPRHGTIDASSWIEDGRVVEGRVALFSAHGPEFPALGVFTHAWLPPAGDGARPLVVDLDARGLAQSPLATTTLRKVWRYDVQRRAWAESLFASGARGPNAALLDGLRLFYGAQTPDSPFQTRAQNIELPAEALVRFHAVALAAPPDAFTRQLWEWIAGVLAGKRQVELIDRFVAPIAAQHAPWPALEVCLARADLEALDAGAALQRLQPLVREDSTDRDLWFTWAEAQEMSGAHAAAVQAWRRLCALEPFEHGPRRRLAMALARAGDPAAQRLIEALLAEHADDEDLRPFLGPGPFPPPGISAQGWRDEH